MVDHGRMGQYDRSHSYDTRFCANLLPNQSRMTIVQNSISVVARAEYLELHTQTCSKQTQPPTTCNLHAQDRQRSMQYHLIQR